MKKQSTLFLLLIVFFAWSSSSAQSTREIYIGAGVPREQNPDTIRGDWRASGHPSEDLRQISQIILFQLG